MKILVNGRCINDRIVGINRYTREISLRLGERVNTIFPSRIEKSFYGVPWEQFILPLKVTIADLLWSPANSGPLLISNQVVTIHDVIPLEHPEWFNSLYSRWYRFLMPKLAV